MGVKSTVSLTRLEAETRLASLLAQKRLPKILRRVVRMSDREIEETLEVENDAVCGGEGFENYVIAEG